MNKYSQLLTKARSFINATGGPSDDTLVFIRCAVRWVYYTAG